MTVRPVGRPPIFTAELGERIIGYAREGNYFVTCADLAEINESTLYDWISKGTDKPSEYPELAEFSTALKRARAEAHREALKTVREGQSGKMGRQWQGEAWFLERTNRDLFGRKEQVDMNARVATVDPSKFSDDDIAGLISILSRANPEEAK